ncbi:hypothetical protein BCR41DRAFT_369521 [Lobosporangium transversale]|uniref:Phosphatidate phosphatase APP1 catalytic domain-containing protein n=1 Tax=Lobosporangium transversale TaxID=64571 RepID=A0A1Y2GS02_9FUNG|nr:hypothetical protein BCR41DRAFT_369521 [Lobosporangium transversale]ORZ20920.1 hypothetical protein BCR41DRAFT_369521 [Lobosporangium transversale]|eukprot:XP_021882829.1 hypothetical protein BCR41DRAFT_369521 [Lobosporangium transversale]
MELAGDHKSKDETVDVLLKELKTPAGALAAAEAAEEKAQLRKSLEENREGYIKNDRSNVHREGSGFEKLDRAVNKINQTPSKGSSSSTASSTNPAATTASGANGNNSSPYIPKDGTPLTRATSPESTEESITGRLTGFMKDTYKRYKPVVMAQVNNGTNYARNRSSTGSSSISSKSSGSDIEKPRSQPGVNGAGTDASILPGASTTYEEDLGYGIFPTVKISSRPGGHFDGTLRVSYKDVQLHRMNSKKGKAFRPGDHPRFLKLRAHHPDMASEPQGIANLIDPEGVSVISDIDDTIKETNIAAGAKIVLQNTFLNEMQDVPGMANVYKEWWKQGVAIHYVSNSPWQLIPSLLDFFHTHKFPPGSAHLRLHDSVLKSYFMSPGEHKRRAISEILTDFPDRKFILIGDSGEIDLEIYTELARNFQGQIFKIFIRNITTARLQEMNAESTADSIIGPDFFTQQGGAGVVNSLKANDTPSDLPTDDIGRASSRTDGDASKSSSRQSVETALGKGETTISDAIAANTTTSVATDRAGSKASEKTATGDGLTDKAILDEEPMPGAPVCHEPAVTKSPLELWADRVEECRKYLPEDMLTIFEDAQALGKCSLVKEKIRYYRDAFTLDEDDENEDEDDGNVKGDKANKSKNEDMGKEDRDNNELPQPQPQNRKIEKLIDV